MTNEQFAEYCRRINLPDAGIRYLEATRSNEPSRPVRSRTGNVIVRYASAKMGAVISAESRTVEFPLILLLENDDSVLEFFDQPQPVQIEYSSANGRLNRPWHTPDFLALKSSEVVLIECKPAARLKELVIKQPHRFKQDANGSWSCPPGEAAAKNLGFSYQIQTDESYNPTLLRNLEFLGDYYDRDYQALTPEKRKLIQSIVQHEPGITILDLLNPHNRLTSEDVYCALGRDNIFVDLSTHDLTDHASARVFPDRAMWLAHGYLTTTKNEEDEPARLENPFANEILQTASPAHLAIATKRMQILFPKNGAPAPSVAERTKSSWLKQYREAETLFGNGFLGLVPKYNLSGNRKPRLPQGAWDLFEKAFDEDYSTSKRLNKTQAYQRFQNRCQDAGYPCPSQVWFSRQIALKHSEQTTIDRQGPRVAYQQQPAINPTAPNENHGDYPFHLAHIDHTQVDVELVDEDTGESIGRPWISVMIDGYSRRVLAFYLSFDSPSYTACLMLLRECVRRHQRLPATVVVDNGAEFRSVAFESFLALYKVTLRLRPPASGIPRLKLCMEMTT